LDYRGITQGLGLDQAQIEQRSPIGLGMKVWEIALAHSRATASFFTCRRNNDGNKTSGCQRNNTDLEQKSNLNLTSARIQAA
jgi:hypothetical protein